MRRWSGWIAIGLMLGLCAIALAGYGSRSRPLSLDERTQAVAAQLRCPVCQGESVADSQSLIARAMRTFIRKSLARGESEAEVKAALLARYPDISLAPSTTGVDSITWLAPPLLVVGGFALVVVLVWDWRRRGREPGTEPAAVYVERVRAELAREEMAGSE